MIHPDTWWDWSTKGLALSYMEPSIKGATEHSLSCIESGLMTLTDSVEEICRHGKLRVHL